MKKIFILLLVGIICSITFSCNTTYKNIKLLTDDSIKFWQSGSTLISFDKRNHVKRVWDDILSPSRSCVIGEPEDTFCIDKDIITIRTMNKIETMKIIDISKKYLKFVWLSTEYSGTPIIYNTNWEQPVSDDVALSVVNDVINRLRDEFDNIESINIYISYLHGVIPNSLPNNVVLLTPSTLYKYKNRKIFVISTPTQTYDKLHCWCGYGTVTLDNYGNILKYNYEMGIEFQYKKKKLKWYYSRKKKYIL